MVIHETHVFDGSDSSLEDVTGRFVSNQRSFPNLPIRIFDRHCQFLLCVVSFFPQVIPI